MMNFKKCDERYYATAVNWYKDKKMEVLGKLNNLIDFFSLLTYEVWGREENDNIYLEFNEDFLGEKGTTDFKTLTYYLTYLESDVIFEDKNEVIFKFENEDFEVHLDKPTEFFYFTV